MFSKRIGHWIGLMLALMLIAAACGGDDETATTTAAPADQGQTETTSGGGGDLGEVSVGHYYGSDLGQQAIVDMNATFDRGEAVINPIEHEAFKTQILVALAGGEPPDVFSYWAGARTASVQSRGQLQTIESVFDNAGVRDDFPAALVDAGIHDGEPYLLPFGYHYVAMFYNPEVMTAAGITTMPTTWDEMIAVADKLVAAGVKPFALGSTARWPAQFWFDFLILRSAGPEYRARLMSGEASYEDAEVTEALELWKGLVDAGYFVDDANAYTWTDAADQVASGEAAMTLMGTWITGYWDGNGLVPGDNYDFFNFPVIDSSIENAALGPIDGWVVAADAANPEGAFALLEHYASPENQLAWAIGQGALPPNTKADTSQLNPIMQKALDEVGKADSYSFNYDLATPPEVAEFGLDMFQAFMDDPSSFAQLQTDTQAETAAAFASGG
jgi:multiple sugar transport system substrate-binding protein/raffinose/stachyose/melibiose transport system substrate-binding protein